MKQTVSIEKIKKNIKNSGFYLNCKIPMGYTIGFPVLQIRNDCLCIALPYLKYQTTGVVDKTLVFPIRYVIWLELPTEKIIRYEDCEYNEVFRGIDFDKPVGYFRHDAIRQYNKAQYNQLYRELMEAYDKVINAILGKGEYLPEDERKLSRLLQLLMEPSLRSMYKVIDPEFYSKYLGEDEKHGI